MNEINYLHHKKTKSLLLEKVEMKAPIVHQQEDVVLTETADAQQLLKRFEEVPHLCSSSLDQQDPHLRIMKQEVEKLWSRQEEEPLPVKIEDDEKPQLFQLHQVKTEDNRETEPPTSSAEQMTETDGEDCGGPESGLAGSQVKSKSDVPQLLKVKEEKVPHPWSSSLGQQDQEFLHIKQEEEELSETVEKYCGRSELKRNHDPNTYLKLNSDEKASNASDTENSDDWVDNMPGSESKSKENDEDWRETRTPGSGVKCKVRHKSVKKFFSCPQCHKQFAYKQSLQKHMTSHSGESSSGLVDKCSKKKQDGGGSQEKRLTCDDCGKNYKDQYYLKCHMRLHRGEKLFACDKCDKTFHFRHYLNYHMSCHMEEKPFACDECGKKFYDKYYLKYHMRLHTKEKPFACDKCGKTFNFIHNLNLHMLQHAGEKFACDQCGKTFTYLITLNRHIKLHTKKERFQCEMCDKTFSTKGNLKQHMALHTGEKPFACSMCEKSFTRCRDLNRHVISHSKVKPFVCIYCRASFSREETLCKHVKLHTEEEPYVCEKCDRRFLKKVSLRRHMIGHVSGKNVSTKKDCFLVKSVEKLLK